MELDDLRDPQRLAVEAKRRAAHGGPPSPAFLASPTAGSSARRPPRPPPTPSGSTPCRPSCRPPSPASRDREGARPQFTGGHRGASTDAATAAGRKRTSTPQASRPRPEPPVDPSPPTTRGPAYPWTTARSCRWSARRTPRPAAGRSHRHRDAAVAVRCPALPAAGPRLPGLRHRAPPSPAWSPSTCRPSAAASPTATACRSPRPSAGLMIVADPTRTAPNAEAIAKILADRLDLDYFDLLAQADREDRPVRLRRPAGPLHAGRQRHRRAQADRSPSASTPAPTRCATTRPVTSPPT